MKNIIVSKDFTDTPGARYKKEGDFSGEEFREKFLEPNFVEAHQNGEKLFIDLDGGYGYATSFLEEAFGGLARKYNADDILSTVKIKSDDEPSLEKDIRDYIINARNKN